MKKNLVKTKISVDILAHGSYSDKILKAIARHNSGTHILCHGDFISYANMERALYPNANEGFFIERINGDEEKLGVTEDGGKSYTIVLEFKEIYELETDPDDLKGILLSGPSVGSETGGDRELDFFDHREY